jgi:homoserine kinase
MDNDSEQLARFEEMGEKSVYIHVLTTGFATAHQRLAIKWLQEKAHESKRRSESAHLEQYRTARTAKNAAIVAAIAATIAVPLAIISIVISTIAWIYPRH